MSRKSKFTSEDVFALAAELFYHPGLSIEELSKFFQYSASSIKRTMHHLRKGNVIQGRLGSPMRLNLALLPDLSHSFCKALVTIERDVKQLKAMCQGKSQFYDAAQDLLAQLCNELPLNDDYRGQIIVETGHMLMGFWPRLDFLIIVYGASVQALYNFVLHGINRTKGVLSSKSLMVVHTLSRCGSHSDNGKRSL